MAHLHAAPPAHEAPVRPAFRAASAWFVELVASVPDDAWEQPGLGEWNVRELVAHTSRSFTTIEDYLAQPAGEVNVHSVVEYFRMGMSVPGVNDQIAQRGRDEVARLGDDPLAYIQALAERVGTLVETTPGDRGCMTFAGVMAFDQYLVSRVFELTVHSVDLATALGRVGADAQPPVSAAAFTLHVLGQLASAHDDRATAIAALTGRAPLPQGWSALG